MTITEAFGEFVADHRNAKKAKASSGTFRSWKARFIKGTIGYYKMREILESAGYVLDIEEQWKKKG